MAEKIAPHGRITIESSDDLRKELLKALRAKPKNLSVDLTGVSYIDTSGWATLVEASRVAHKQGTKLILTGIHDQPQYLLQISRLTRSSETSIRASCRWANPSMIASGAFFHSGTIRFCRTYEKARRYSLRFLEIQVGRLSKGSTEFPTRRLLS